MEAYAKLTDNVFLDIQNSSCYQLKKSRETLEKINKRKQYKLVSEAIPSEESKLEVDFFVFWDFLPKTVKNNHCRTHLSIYINITKRLASISSQY